MRFLPVLYYAALAVPSVSGLAIRQSGGNKKTCDTDPLTQATWTNLNMDQWLKNWTPNVTAQPTNNVQALADSFGAPNFFCGLDQFCNAGQPCNPVELPAWYSLLAIQSWNNYMNSVNTAITFATNIISLKLGEIVSDLYPKPKDDVTPFNAVIRAISSTLAVVPMTGGLANIGKGAFDKSVGYIFSVVKPPTTDKFLQWTNVAASLAGVVQDYQAAVSDSFKKIIDTPVADAGGIYAQLEGGRFLGISQNFTQSDLQKQMIDSFTLYSIGLALQAQKIFVNRMTGIARKHDDSSASYMVDGDDGKYIQYSLLQADGSNSNLMLDIGQKLTDKYGLSKERFLGDVFKCWEQNGKKQLADGFGDVLPIDPNTPCLLNMQVCDMVGVEWSKKSIIDVCRENGLDI
ncbi:hypothetical protein F53441_13806 [Fusarium austroafricanum]|uniref:DUF7872 domain-containing protein n=1 Tax=Fusarium austroafricanum TaxID=2364996 RepID=A0A8H4JN64_9HYPO|nr:hypothetical protein F53441_13806 [Fusarium austroafricanum]